LTEWREVGRDARAAALARAKGAAVSGILDEGGLPVMATRRRGRALGAGEIPVGAGGAGRGVIGPVTVKPLALRMLGQDEAESLILAQNERWRRA
jgi:hypothetical protein